MKYKNYAKELTYEYLKNHGINIRFDLDDIPHPYYYNTELSCKLDPKSGYYKFLIFSLDKDGNRIKVYPNPGTKKAKVPGWYNYQRETIVLSRAVYAWVYGKVDDGMVVDHINNKHNELVDYKIDNLQLLSVSDNVTKKTNKNTKQIKLKKKTYTIDELNLKLDELEAEYQHYLALGNKYNVDIIKNIRTKKAYWKAIKRGLMDGDIDGKKN